VKLCGVGSNSDATPPPAIAGHQLDLGHPESQLFAGGGQDLRPPVGEDHQSQLLAAVS
jgi:hypothetical protein